MAGDWIKMRGNLWDDPRVARVCDLTGAGEAAVVGAMYWLWATADQHSVDGLLSGLSSRAIDRKTGLPGFGAAMIEIGWISESDDGVAITRFEEHNGSSAKQRAVTAKRVAKHRAGNAINESIEGGRNGTDTDDSGQCNADSVTGALAREREREREEETPHTPLGVEAVDELIAHLNRRAGSGFKPTEANRGLVRARLNEGFTEADIRAVIDDRVSRWKDDSKMSAYLRPATLFGREKFSQYHGQLPVAATGGEKWWRIAGFENEWVARNAMCNEVTYPAFENGAVKPGYVRWNGRFLREEEVPA